MENSPSNRSLSYLQLPARLQSHILALAGAPLNTCKASAAIACSPDFTATWLAATHPRPFEAAGYLQKWGVCLHMLDSGHHITGPQLATVLSPAAAAGQVELVKRLIDAGAWAELSAAGHSIWKLLEPRSGGKDRHAKHARPKYLPRGIDHPLAWAAKHGQLEVCRLLVAQETPADVGYQALGVAAEAGHIPVMQLLVDCIPGISAPGAPYLLPDRPLVLAARGGHVSAVQFLLDQGADLLNGHGTPFCGPGTSCLRAAAKGAAHDMLRFLLSQQVAWHGEYQWLPALAEAAQQGDASAVQLLLDSAPTPDWADDYNLSTSDDPLFLASKRGHTAVMELLLDQEMGMPEISMIRSFFIATEQGHTEAMGLLRRSGVSLHCGLDDEFEEETPLRYAIKVHQATSVKWLLEHGDRAYEEDLLFAMQEEAWACVRVMLAHGVRDDHNHAIYTAGRFGSVKGVNLFLQANLPAAPEQADAITAKRLQVALCGAASMGRLALIKAFLGTPPPPAPAGPSRGDPASAGPLSRSNPSPSAVLAPGAARAAEQGQAAVAGCDSDSEEDSSMFTDAESDTFSVRPDALAGEQELTSSQRASFRPVHKAPCLSPPVQQAASPVSHPVVSVRTAQMTIGAAAAPTPTSPATGAAVVNSRQPIILRATPTAPSSKTPQETSAMLGSSGEQRQGNQPAANARVPSSTAAQGIRSRAQDTQPATTTNPRPDEGRLRLLDRLMEAAAAGEDRYCYERTHHEDLGSRQWSCGGDCSFCTAWPGGDSGDYRAVAEFLLSLGADPTFSDCRCLLTAIEFGSKDIVDLLLPLCAHHPAVTAGSAMWLAVQVGNLDAVQQLEPHSQISAEAAAAKQVAPLRRRGVSRGQLLNGIFMRRS